MGSLAGFVARSSITLQEETSIWLQSQPSYVFLQTELLDAFGLSIVHAERCQRRAGAPEMPHLRSAHGAHEHPGGDRHLSDAAHLQMHGLQVHHGGDGQDAFRLIPIDSFGDYAVARNAVIASKLGERAKSWCQANKLHRRSALFAGARLIVGGSIAAHAERILHPLEDRQRRHHRLRCPSALYELRDHAAMPVGERRARPAVSLCR